MLQELPWSDIRFTRRAALGLGLREAAKPPACPEQTDTGIYLISWLHSTDSEKATGNNSASVVERIGKEIPHLQSIIVDSNSASIYSRVNVSVKLNPDLQRWTINETSNTYNITLNPDQNAIPYSLFSSFKPEVLDQIDLVSADFLPPVIENGAQLNKDIMINRIFPWLSWGLTALAATAVVVGGINLLKNKKPEARKGKQKRRPATRAESRGFLVTEALFAAGGIGAIAEAVLFNRFNQAKKKEADEIWALMQDNQSKAEQCLPFGTPEAPGLETEIALRDAVMDLKVRGRNAADGLPGNKCAYILGTTHLKYKNSFDRDIGEIRPAFTRRYQDYLDQARTDLNNNRLSTDAYASCLQKWLQYFTELFINYSSLEVSKLSKPGPNLISTKPYEQKFYPELLADFGFSYDWQTEAPPANENYTKEELYAFQRRKRTIALFGLVNKEFEKNRFFIQ